MMLALALGCVAALLAIALAALAAIRLSRATSLTYAASLGASLMLLATALVQLLGRLPAADLRLPLGLPWIGANFHLDALSAFFLAIVNLGAAAASLYALGYGKHEHDQARVLPFYPAFLAGMNAVILAADAFAFLFSWEMMSLASWALVLAHHREEDNLKAGYVYIVMASFGSLVLLLAFGLLAGSQGGYAFDQIRHHVPAGAVTATVLALATLGAGSKAGLVPLHVWLPLAHPAAPSHVSALMSGVMTKVAIYAFIRIVFDLLGPPDWWWSVPILAAAGASAVLGILQALMQTDLKRLLAYSTIENVGLIFAGLGLALAFQANGLHAAAALAMTAALFHILNHTLFKSVLFFGAGAVLTATGQRDLNALGGLIHRMPVTSVVVLVACVAISALPPLNGFASEWLTFQAILLSPQIPQWGLKLLVPAVGALLALSAALAAACFVRTFGTIFLGRPRTLAAQEAREIDRWSQSAMIVLASLCLLAGVLPGLVIDGIAPAVFYAVQARMPAQAGVDWLTIIPVAASRSSYNGLLVFVFITFSASLSAYAIHRLASRAVRRGPAWDCGFPDASPITQYSATSFSQPIRRVYGATLFRARESVDMPRPGDQRPAGLLVSLRDLVWDGIYGPLARAVLLAADRLDRLQYLTIRQYLSLVFLLLVFLLVVLASWP
ncbi:hydrogenase 4 subunit B [Labrys okinawensis]|uniref:Hydrogenase 4 subunit B n=1 Tax=Labrys okinawensis TaxID=346911 RepID=A0A2S9QIJ7_9HYPH|nr:hydrogenase 4 subunit B [Labrys okinawensis]PRH89142.1 hydrogenase 4 subunit B [Labrys okinawensis]